jgi:hypothetical protein
VEASEAIINHLMLPFFFNDMLIAWKIWLSPNLFYNETSVAIFQDEVRRPEV